MAYRYRIVNAPNIWANFLVDSRYSDEIELQSWWEYTVWCSEKLKPWNATLVGSIDGIVFENDDDAVAFKLKYS